MTKNVISKFPQNFFEDQNHNGSQIFMPKSKKDYDDDEEEEFEDDDEFEESSFKCRSCGKDTLFGEGDDMILLCDDCLEKYDEDKIWDDFDNEKILEENLKSFNLTPYLLKKGKKK